MPAYLIGELMARKPNYRFERFERERQNAAKKAARIAAKREKAAAKREAQAEEVSTETTEEAKD